MEYLMKSRDERIDYALNKALNAKPSEVRVMVEIDIDLETYQGLVKLAGGVTSHGGRRINAIIVKILREYLASNENR
jgi:hypothetical protein